MGEDICTLFYLVINTWKYFNGIPNICSIKISRVLGYGHSTDFLSGWSTEGVRTVSTGGNETHCYTTHLTSFAVMLVNRNFVLYSITVEYCIFIFTLYKSGLALKKTKVLKKNWLSYKDVLYLITLSWYTGPHPHTDVTRQPRESLDLHLLHRVCHLYLWPGLYHRYLLYVQVRTLT